MQNGRKPPDYARGGAHVKTVKLRPSFKKSRGELSEARQRHNMVVELRQARANLEQGLFCSTRMEAYNNVHDCRLGHAFLASEGWNEMCVLLPSIFSKLHETLVVG